MKFDNDTATDDERRAYLNSKKAEVYEVDGEPDTWELSYSGGVMCLDANNEGDALFEACNIV